MQKHDAKLSIETNAASYEELAPYYAALTRATGRIQRQRDVLVELLDRFGIQPEAPILDLGCGPGTVLRELGARGYSDLYGIDVAKHMVMHARQQAPAAHIAHASWQSLASTFADAPPFAAVYSLSQTITHADAAEVRTVFDDVPRLLRNGGFLFIDVRAWCQDSRGRRIEPDRPAHVWRLGPLIDVADGSYWVDDQCWYEGGRQHVEYRFRRRRRRHPGWDAEHMLRVSYNTLSSDEYVAILHRVGFDDVTVLKHDEWPYLIIAARICRQAAHMHSRPAD